MAVIFPGLDSPEFDAAFRAAAGHIDELAALFDRLQVGRREPAPLTPETVRDAETVIERVNAVLSEVTTISAYLNAFVTTDSRDNLAQATYSELQQHTVKLSQLTTRFVAW